MSLHHPSEAAPGFVTTVSDKRGKLHVGQAKGLQRASEDTWPVRLFSTENILKAEASGSLTQVGIFEIYRRIANITIGIK